MAMKSLASGLLKKLKLDRLETTDENQPGPDDTIESLTEKNPISRNRYASARRMPNNLPYFVRSSRRTAKHFVTKSTKWRPKSQPSAPKFRISNASALARWRTAS
jgi:hypothetical protein